MPIYSTTLVLNSKSRHRNGGLILQVDRVLIKETNTMTRKVEDVSPHISKNSFYVV